MPIMKIIAGIEAQPNFPHEDLTDDNAAMLELLLSSNELVESMHTISEKTILVYRVGHRVVSSVAARAVEQDTLLRAINHGTTVYETISAMIVAQDKTQRYQPHVIHDQSATWMAADSTALITYQQEASASFSQELPVTKEVIASASTRHYPYLTGYAVLGAAMARQFELDCITSE